jgi:hypothetical protein
MYREVTMIELKEVLRLWSEGLPKKRLAAQLGLDPKTVRRYVAVAAAAGVRAGTATVTDEQVRDVLLALHPAGGRPRGDSWSHYVAQRAAIERWLKDGLRLTKIRKPLGRQGVGIPYPTLHRFAVLELQFGKTAPTIPVLDGEPGPELQVDTGWVGWVTLLHGPRRRFWASRQSVSSHASSSGFRFQRRGLPGLALASTRANASRLVSRLARA